MTYVDHPEKRQKHPHYEHRTVKLDRKDNNFTSKKFHHIRKVSTHKKILKSFGRIGMCLNNKSYSAIATGDLDKVCLILVNDYENEEDELGVGPLNDGYLVGLKHHRLGYKVFYLYNPKSEEFKTYLSFFMKNTQINLTVFYSGRNTNGNLGIEFVNGSVSHAILGEIIAQSCTGKPRVMFITDCIGGGSVFDINYTGPENKNYHQSNMLSFFVRKVNPPQSKRSKRSHGICTYYFSKFTSECPTITPNRLIERMNPSINRFDEVFLCEVTNLDLADKPIFASN